jgi:hypothetical protein
VTDKSLTVGQILAPHTDRLGVVNPPDAPRSGIIVGQDSVGVIELVVDRVAPSSDVNTRAELITDPVLRHCGGPIQREPARRHPGTPR